MRYRVVLWVGVAVASGGVGPGLPAGTVLAGSGWWNARWQRRVPIVLRETHGVARTNEPVVIPGRAIRRSAGLRHITIASLRVVCDGHDVPVQVDERDTHNVYYYQGAGNGVVDNQDEIVFEATLKPRETKRYDLYFGVTGGFPTAHYATSLSVRQNRRDPRYWDGAVSNGAMTVGVRGGGPSTAYGGHGKGSITRLAVAGTELLHMGHSYGNCFRGQFTSAPWSPVMPVVTGPVRAIVGLQAEGVELAWGKAKVTGSVYRYVIVYRGVPLAVFRETIRVPTTTPKRVLAYTLPLHPSGDPRDWMNERVIGPRGKGKITTVDYKGPAYQAKGGQARWVAYHNGERRRGLAVFCPQHRTESVWAHLMSRRSKLDTIMTSAWGAMHTTAECTLRVTVDPSRPIEHEIGFYGLTGPGPDEAASRFQCLWQSPLSRHVTLERAEVKP